MAKRSKKSSSDEEKGATHYLSYIIQLALSISAAYLNWNCLHNQTMLIRVGLTVLSFFFAVYYLVFYLIFKVIMGQTCS